MWSFLEAIVRSVDNQRHKKKMTEVEPTAWTCKTECCKRVNPNTVVWCPTCQRNPDGERFGPVLAHTIKPLTEIRSRAIDVQFEMVSRELLEEGGPLSQGMMVVFNSLFDKVEQRLKASGLIVTHEDGRVHVCAFKEDAATLGTLLALAGCTDSERQLTEFVANRTLVPR